MIVAYIMIGKYIMIVAYIMKSKAGNDYLSSAAHYAAKFIYRMIVKKGTFDVFIENARTYNSRLFWAEELQILPPTAQRPRERLRLRRRRNLYSIAAVRETLAAA